MTRGENVRYSVKNSRGNKEIPKRVHLGFLLLRFLVLSGVIAPFTHAQITLDGTMGPSGPLTGPDYVISDNLGQLKGTNLFHSFGEFNVLTGESATFTGPDVIENVIGRVTGGNESFIDGLIKSEILDADLFLLNHWGFMFGPHATLDLNGSFHVSTGDYLKLSDGGILYVDPAEASVLTVAPPEAFGFLGDNHARISFQESMLSVPAGETLSIVGGDIDIAGGSLGTHGGRINLVSVASAGEVTSHMDIASFEQLGEIDIREEGYVNTSGDPAGTVFIRGGNLTVDYSSIDSSSDGSSDGGNIDIRLKEDLVLANEGRIVADADYDGDASDVTIEAHNISISAGGYIKTRSYSSGDAGEISLTVGTLEINEESSVESSTEGSGDAGNITVTATDMISISGSADNVFRTGISSEAFLCSGDAGDIHVSTPNITLESGVISTESVLASGNSGDVHVEVGSLELTGGALITSGTSGPGKGGAITVNATDSISIADFGSALESTTGSSGNAGSISVCTPALIIKDYGYIEATTFGDGNAGDVFLEVGNLTLKDSGRISTEVSLFKAGRGGNITVSATDSIFISHQSSDSFVSAGISTRTNGSGDGGTISMSTPTLIMNDGTISAGASIISSGRAGDISLNVGSLTLMDGASIDTSTLGVGDGGELNITAETVSLSGYSVNVWGDFIVSGIASITGSEGNGGNIVLDARTLTLTDGSQISAFSSGNGAGGGLNITAVTVSLSGYSVDGERNVYSSGLYNSAESEGHAGSISLDVGSLMVSNGATIGTWSRGAGNGGEIRIVAETVSLSGYGAISEGIFLSSLDSDSFAEGNAGNIILNAGTLTLTDGAQITSSSRGDGDGGEVGITAESVGISGFAVKSDGTIFESGLFSSANGEGSGGSILLQAEDVQLNNKGMISAESTGSGYAGSVSINATDKFLSSDGSVTTEATETDGGNIQISAGYMVHLVDSELTASVGGGPETEGGNITIDPEYVILNGSKIIANAFEGRGGNIRISAGTFLADPESTVDASSALGIDGTVDIRSPIVNVSSIVAPLSRSYVSAVQLLSEPCEARIKGGKYSSFIIKGRGGLPLQPEGILPSPVN